MAVLGCFRKKHKKKTGGERETESANESRERRNMRITEIRTANGRSLVFWRRLQHSARKKTLKKEQLFPSMKFKIQLYQFVLLIIFARNHQL